jgi:uncharacterized hydrophobic protein (TIGR00341 family)
MKRVTAITRKKDREDIENLVKDTYHFIEYENNLLHVIIFLHDSELNDFLDKLEDVIDLRYKESIIEVSTPDFIISTALERTERKAIFKERTPVERLVDSTKPHLGIDFSKIALTSIAGMIALTGLFLNNIPIVIGAMLLAPLLGPIHAFAINTAVGRPKNVLKSIGNLSLQLIMVVVFSFIATILISQVVDLTLTEEILTRMDSNFIYMVMAILLGLASIFALDREISESIAGIAIAAALLPPAVVTGITFQLCPQDAVRPLLLTLENVLGLITGALAATFILQIGPRGYYRKAKAKKLIVWVFAVLLVLVLLLLFFSFCL